MLSRRIAIFRPERIAGLMGLFLLGGAVAARGQQAVPASSVPATVSTGTIGGSVICADTNAPARLAQVVLRSTTPSDAGAEMLKGLDQLRGLGGEDSDSKKTPTLQVLDSDIDAVNVTVPLSP
jgi:hypothetical protein